MGITTRTNPPEPRVRLGTQMDPCNERRLTSELGLYLTHSQQMLDDILGFLELIICTARS